MHILPIKTEEDFYAAVSRIEALMGAALNTPEGDELDVLATLVSAYEDKHHALPPPTAVGAILFHLDQQGLTRKDLEPLIGTRARVSEVLSGKRPLTLAMVRRLHASLGISADILIASTKPARRRSSTPLQRKSKQQATAPPVRNKGVRAIPSRRAA